MERTPARVKVNSKACTDYHCHPLSSAGITAVSMSVDLTVITRCLLMSARPYETKEGLSPKF